ncbi:hypothetical protein CR513_20264, partial [Mucuna pruriens]
MEVPNRGNNDTSNNIRRPRRRGHKHRWDRRGDPKQKDFRPEELTKQRPDTCKEGQSNRSAKEDMSTRYWISCTRLQHVSHSSHYINLEGHRNLLLNVLNDPHVAQDITSKKFEGIINNIMASCHLSFFEDEVPTEGRGDNHPLHIVVKCGNYMIARVLIDNGSSLNVMPNTTLDKLYSTSSTLKTSSVVVRAFDGSKREVIGKITLPIRIGPTTFDITFQVMDIRPTYSCLLGRPGIDLGH